MPANKRKGGGYKGYATGRVYKKKSTKAAEGSKAAAEELLRGQTPKQEDPVKRSKDRRKTKRANRKRQETSFLKKLSDQGYMEAGQKRFTETSIKWFQKIIKDFKSKEVKGDIRDRILKEGEEGRAKPGYMYTYIYDAKWKDKLPYWDAMPLIFLVSTNKTGWLGLNLHYLPLNLRAYFMKQLLTLSNNQLYTDRTKLKLSWAMLQQAADHPLLQICVKRYLSSHVESKAVQIPASQWEAALWLPTANWQKKSESYVWKQANKAFYK